VAAGLWPKSLPILWRRPPNSRLRPMNHSPFPYAFARSFGTDGTGTEWWRGTCSDLGFLQNAPALLRRAFSLRGVLVSREFRVFPSRAEDSLERYGGTVVTSVKTPCTINCVNFVTVPACDREYATVVLWVSSTKSAGPSMQTSSGQSSVSEVKFTSRISPLVRAGQSV